MRIELIFFVAVCTKLLTGCQEPIDKGHLQDSSLNNQAVQKEQVFNVVSMFCIGVAVHNQNLAIIELHGTFKNKKAIGMLVLPDTGVIEGNVAVWTRDYEFHHAKLNDRWELMGYNSSLNTLAIQASNGQFEVHNVLMDNVAHADQWRRSRAWGQKEE